MEALHLFTAHFYKKLTGKSDKHALAKAAAASAKAGGSGGGSGRGSGGNGRGGGSTQNHSDDSSDDGDFGDGGREGRKRNAAEASLLAHLNVERWTKDLDLFGKRFTVVPIVDHLHWSVAIICNLDRLEDHWRRWRTRALRAREPSSDTAAPGFHKRRLQTRGGGAAARSSEVCHIDSDSDASGADDAVTGFVTEQMEYDAPGTAPNEACSPDTFSDSEGRGADGLANAGCEEVTEGRAQDGGLSTADEEFVEVDEDHKDEDGGDGGGDARVPCIVFMDSLNMHPAAQVAANLRSYLLHEYRAKRAASAAAAEAGPAAGPAAGEDAAQGESPGSSKRRRRGEGASAGASEGDGGGKDTDDDDDEAMRLSRDAFVEALFGDGDGCLPLLRPRVRTDAKQLFSKCTQFELFVFFVSAAAGAPVPLLPHRGVQVPVQDNCCDCGVFALQYVQELVARWPPITQRDVDAGAVPGFSRTMFSPRQIKVRSESGACLPFRLSHSTFFPPYASQPPSVCGRMIARGSS